MAVDPTRLQIDQLTRVIEAMGWKVTRSDLTGAEIVLEIKKPKPT